MNVVEEIKDRIDVVELIGESVKLRKSGKNYTGFCPFHANTHTPAFVVFPDTGTWRCFGACNEGGDVFTFVMKKEGWDFPEALRVLAQRVGVELEPASPRQAAEAEAHERLRDLLESSVTFFRHQLNNSPAGEPVMAYLKGRGLSGQAIETFEIGYAPASWDETLNYLHGRGYSHDEILRAGMSSEREGGGTFDRFRNRIIFPIRDSRGRMAGFGARIVDPDDMPKFLNSPQTPVFDKGRLLYGLDKARKAIRLNDQAVIVEGYLDVIALHQAGYENVVSPMGTALSEPQLYLLKRYSRRIVLALDADAAGDKATLRGLDIARGALDREMDPVFDARGLVRHEGRLDAELRIVTLPDGLDPDEVVAESPDRWSEILAGAQTVVDYVMEVAAKGRDLEDAKVKAEVARQVLPLIEDVADPVEREAYRQKLARTLHVDERALMAWRTPGRRVQRAGRGVPGQAESGASGRRSASGEDKLERFCMGVLLRSPSLVHRLDRDLQDLGLKRLAPDDFGSTERRIMFEGVRRALTQDAVDPQDAWRESLDASLLTLAEDLLAEISDLDLDEPRAFNEVVAAFLRLRKRSLSFSTGQLQFQLLAAQDAEEDVRPTGQEVEHMKQEVQQLALERARLEQALSRRGPEWAAAMSQGWSG